MPGLRNPKGFNLFELLVVLSITAILIMVALPYFASMSKTQRLIGATENLYSVLQNARTEAIKRNTTVYVSFQTGASWCYGVNSGSACTCTTPSGCNLGAVTAPNANLSLSTTGLSGTPVQLQFESTRGAANVANTIVFTLSDNSAAMTIKTGVLGNASICSSQVGGYPSTCT